MQTQKLVLTCPVCASKDVYYTCTPDCCFNHVCGECRTTFEPVTAATGAKVSGVVPPDPLPVAGDPTVACAKCYGIAVYRAGDETLVCAGCGAVLVLELTEVAPG
ncbi:MAG: hypothetical protein LAP40_21065 [Acidobacteriia bacterium]|nr:hypothetical protein [Terriglobia bacterium]